MKLAFRKHVSKIFSYFLAHVLRREPACKLCSVLSSVLVLLFLKEKQILNHFQKKNGRHISRNRNQLNLNLCYDLKKILSPN